jgi:hypothetical protein
MKSMKSAQTRRGPIRIGKQLLEEMRSLNARDLNALNNGSTKTPTTSGQIRNDRGSMKSRLSLESVGSMSVRSLYSEYSTRIRIDEEDENSSSVSSRTEMSTLESEALDISISADSGSSKSIVSSSTSTITITTSSSSSNDNSGNYIDDRSKSKLSTLKDNVLILKLNHVGQVYQPYLIHKEKLLIGEINYLVFYHL